MLSIPRLAAGLSLGDVVTLSPTGINAGEESDYKTDGTDDAIRPGEHGKVVQFDDDGDPIVRGPRGREQAFEAKDVSRFAAGPGSGAVWIAFDVNESCIR